MSSRSFLLAGLNLSIVVVGLLLSALAAETVLRWMHYPYRPVDVHRRNADPVLLYELIPHVRVYKDRTNGDGFRDREFLRPKPPGVFRILALGDSVTVGYGITDPRETLPKTLERELNRGRSPEDTRIEVLNFGIDGYNTLQEERLLEVKGLSLDPDLVLVFYILNDPEDPITNQVFQGERHCTLFGVSVPCGFLNLLKRSVLLNFALDASRALKGRGSSISVDYFHHLHIDPSRFGHVEDAFERFDRLQRSRKLPVVVVIFPLFQDFGHYPWRDVHAQVAAAARSHGLPVVDLLSAFQGANARRLRFLGSDVIHPNPRGIRAASSALARDLIKTGLVPRGPGH